MADEKKVPSHKGCLAAIGVALVLVVVIATIITVCSREPSREDSIECLKDLECIQE